MYDSSLLNRQIYYNFLENYNFDKIISEDSPIILNKLEDTIFKTNKSSDNNKKELNKFKDKLPKINLNKNSKKIISRYRNKNLKDISVQKNLEKDIKESIKELFTIKFDASLPKSIIIVFIIMIINTFMLSIFTGIFGSSLALPLVSVLITPITEELGKYISIKNNSEGNFLAVFNAIEYTTYVTRFPSKIMYILRLVPMAMHYLTTLVQKRKLEKEDEKDSAFITGVLIHSLYNAVCCLL